MLEVMSAMAVAGWAAVPLLSCRFMALFGVEVEVASPKRRQSSVVDSATERGAF